MANYYKIRNMPRWVKKSSTIMFTRTVTWKIRVCCGTVTLVHYFVNCADVVIFWKQFAKMWKRTFEYWFPLSEVDILFSVQNEISDGNIDTLNYGILLAKFYIYLTKKNGDKKSLFFKFRHIC